MTSDRLSGKDWLDAGLEAIAQHGFTALKADVLAKQLKVSRGSFYWHFADVAAFHTAILQHWRAIAYENIVIEIDGSSSDRLRHLLVRAFGVNGKLESAIRSWAQSDPKAKSMAAAVDQRRMDYVAKLLLALGISSDLAKARARILYWTYLGHAIQADSLTQSSRDLVIAELLQLATARPKQR